MQPTSWLLRYLKNGLNIEWNHSIADPLGPTYLSFVERLISIRCLPKIDHQKSIDVIVVNSHVTTEIITPSREYPIKCDSNFSFPDVKKQTNS